MRELPACFSARMCRASGLHFVADPSINRYSTLQLPVRQSRAFASDCQSWCCVSRAYGAKPQVEAFCLLSAANILVYEATAGSAEWVAYFFTCVRATSF